MSAGSPEYVETARHTQVLGRVSRVRSDSPLSDAVVPVEEYATATLTPPPAVRDDRSMRTTFGSPNAAATCACVRTRGTQARHGFGAAMLHGSATDCA